MPLSPRALLDRLILAAVERHIAPRLAAQTRILLNREALPTGAHLRVARPRTANEKYLWRKIFDHDPRFVTVSDKLASKDWVAALGLDVEIPPVLWVGTDAARIPPALLERPGVLKANHGSGTNIFLPGPEPHKKLVRRANAMLELDHGRMFDEWSYFGISRKLFLEEQVGREGAPIMELKLFTFGRRIERILYLADRFGEPAATWWEPDPGGGFVRNPHPTHVSPRLLDGPLPPCAERALEVAAEIGHHFDHMRVDFLTDGERLWFGELTVYNLGGFVHGLGHDPASQMTQAWDLRESWFLTVCHHDWRKRLYARALRRELERAAAGRSTGAATGHPSPAQSARTAPRSDLAA